MGTKICKWNNWSLSCFALSLCKWPFSWICHWRCCEEKGGKLGVPKTVSSQASYFWNWNCCYSCVSWVLLWKVVREGHGPLGHKHRWNLMAMGGVVEQGRSSKGVSEYSILVGRAGPFAAQHLWYLFSSRLQRCRHKWVQEVAAVCCVCVRCRCCAAGAWGQGNRVGPMLEVCNMTGLPLPQLWAWCHLAESASSQAQAAEQGIEIGIQAKQPKQ